MAESASENRRSIAQVNRMIRSIIEAETLENFFWVGGRIDRFYRSELGHVYFDLVDDQNQVVTRGKGRQVYPKRAAVRQITLAR